MSVATHPIPQRIIPSQPNPVGAYERTKKKRMGWLILPQHLLVFLLVFVSCWSVDIYFHTWLYISSQVAEISQGPISFRPSHTSYLTSDLP